MCQSCPLKKAVTNVHIATLYHYERCSNCDGSTYSVFCVRMGCSSLYIVSELYSFSDSGLTIGSCEMASIRDCKFLEDCVRILELHPITFLFNNFSCRNDIGPPPSWDNLFRILNELVPSTGFAGPGGWNDLDLLEVGNVGLTMVEQQTHFAFWAAAKSPLLISTDLTQISEEALEILTNKRVIALNVSNLRLLVLFITF